MNILNFVLLNTFGHFVLKTFTRFEIQKRKQLFATFNYIHIYLDIYTKLFKLKYLLHPFHFYNAVCTLKQLLCVAQYSCIFIQKKRKMRGQRGHYWLFWWKGEKGYTTTSFLNRKCYFVYMGSVVVKLQIK